MITVKLILEKISYSRFIGNTDYQISQIVKLSPNLEKYQICWCSDKNLDKLSAIKCGTIICSNNIEEKYFSKDCNYIITENPRLTFNSVLDLFSSDKEIDFVIENTASVHPLAVISSKVKIGHNVVIDKDVVIGEGTIIGHNTVILKGVKIGKNVKIGSNNTIGSIGFGYEKESNGEYRLINHIGNVVIEDNVEIGNNTAIDRAVLGSTILRKNVKIDNLVHIAHGVEIGENSLIIANSMIGGSVKIGKNCWVAPSSSVLNQKSIGDNALIGMGAVVLKDVPDNDIVVGNPAKSLNRNKK